MHEDLLLPFLEGRGPDAKGRLIEDIWAWDDYTLEITHNYIQWLFPLTVPSEHVDRTPVLDKVTLSRLRQSRTAQLNQDRSRKVMREFFYKTKGWHCEYDHNHLRISRIIESSVLICGRETGQSFFDFIIGEFTRRGRRPPAEALSYWRSALDPDPLFGFKG